MKNIFNCNKYYNEKYKNELNFRYCLREFIKCFLKSLKYILIFNEER